jgi:hypothetical protein
MPIYTRRILQTTPLYATPDEAGTRLGDVPLGRFVRVLDIQSGWLQVEEMSDVSRAGFIPIKALTPPRGGMRSAVLPQQPSLEEEAETTPSGPPAEEISDGRDLPPMHVDEPPATAAPELTNLEPAYKITGTNTYIERVTAGVWNKYGRLLGELAAGYGIDPVIAAAVMAVESGGSAFGPDGKLLIRFENHLFYHYWGKDNQEIYSRYFQFNAVQRWREHTFRSRLSDAFEAFHGDQHKEWLAFGQAHKLAARPALLSISMGAPQILGSNHRRIGYGSPEAMFAAFSDASAGERNGIVAFFKFIENDPRNRGIPALRNEDYVAFAEMYNGSGQAETYGSLIAERVRILRALLAH